MATIRCLFKGCNETHEIFVAKNGRPYINCSGLANKFYGNTGRIYGYAYGQSGGSVQMKGAAEGATGVWDGIVPVVGSESTIPRMVAPEIR